MGKAKIWNKKTKDINEEVLPQCCVGFSAIFYRDQCHSRNKEYSFNTQEKAKGYPVSKGKEEFLEQGSTVDAEPIKSHEFFQTQQNYGERWKRKPAVYNSLYHKH